MTTDSVPAHNDRENLIGLLRRVNTTDNSEYLADYLLSSEWLSSLLATARADGAREQREIDAKIAEETTGPIRTLPSDWRAVEIAAAIRRTVVPLTTEEKK